MLNKDQENAVDGFFNFLMNPKQKEFIISGPAGTGKTYLMGYLIDNVIPRYIKTCKLLGVSPRYNNVVMTATTNKAAEVLGNATKKMTDTIYSHLGLVVQDNYKTGQSNIKRNPRKWRMHSNEIIFIDECSMIDWKLYDELQKATNDCKIIYVGDHCQLAPVGYSISPIYERNIPFFELKEQMRNNGSQPLQNICNQLRTTVETGAFFPIKTVKGSIELLTDNEMQNELHSTFKDFDVNSKVLAYTNNRVLQYSDYIRQDIRQIHEPYIEKEVLINNSPFDLGGKTLSAEEPVKITKVSKEHVITLNNDIAFTGRQLWCRNRFIGDFSTYAPSDRDAIKNDLKRLAYYKDWKSYFLLKNNNIDLRPKEVSTIHKSQGSTYDSVFIDLGDVSNCIDPKTAARLLYVAFSRARSKVYLYGDLKSKFGGVVTGN